MTNRFRRMPVKTEMAAGQREIGGYCNIFPPPRSEQGAIIANSKRQGGRPRSGGAPADLAEDLQFSGPSTGIFPGTGVPRFGMVNQHLS